MSGRKAKLSLPKEFRDEAVVNMRDRALELLQGSNPVFIDAQRTQSVDTAGLQFLLMFSQALQAQDRDVSWSDLNPGVMSQVKIGGFEGPLGLTAAGSDA